MRPFVLVLTFLFLSWQAPAGILGTFRCGSAVIAALDSSSAAPLLAASDSYTRSFTSFDLQSKVGPDGELTERGYLRKAAGNARTWTMLEVKVLEREIRRLAGRMAESRLRPAMPDTIWMIKTTAGEEYGAEGYTRRNMIMLNATKINYRLIAHELFHVISRRDTVRRDMAYATIGFKKCNPVDVAGALRGLSITNPDCPVIGHYITLKDKQDRLRDFVLVIYSERPYSGGDIFTKYLTPGFIEVSGRGMDKRPVMENGKPVLAGLYDFPDLFNKVGNNTSYLLHAEEICAEHFAMWATKEFANSPQYIRLLERVLQ